MRLYQLTCCLLFAVLALSVATNSASATEQGHDGGGKLITSVTDNLITYCSTISSPPIVKPIKVFDLPELFQASRSKLGPLVSLRKFLQDPAAYFLRSKAQHDKEVNGIKN